MGDRNQILFLEKFIPKVDGPVLEVGSKDYGNTASFRATYPGCEYVGVDIEEGPGVDQIVDLAEGIGPLPENHFQLTVCCSVLEHVPKPWKMAENLTRVTAPGGKLYIAVPWVWRYHPYPDDYFRISFRGVASLFPDFEWGQAYYSTNQIGEFLNIPPESPGSDDRMALLVPMPNGAKRKYLPYLMVNMIGVKR